MRKVGTWITAALCTTALVVACGDTPFTPEGVAGAYALISIDGESLPTDGVSAGSLSLQASGTYTISMTLEGGGDPYTGAGTYALSGSNTIQFTNVGAGDFDNFTGILDGNEITVDDPELVFRK